MLDDLYRDVLLEHYRSPRNRRRLDAPTIAQRGMNPVCGDEVEVALRLDAENLAEVAFQGTGCSISQASASMMTDLLDGRTFGEAAEVVAAFKRMMVGDGTVDEDALGDASALSGVRRFPVRVKCATLAWNTLEEALALYQKRTIG